MILRPLEQLDSLAKETPGQQPCQLAERFLSSLGASTKVPSLNLLPAARVPHESLVKFRGMVQATLEPEFYSRAGAGCFRDRCLATDDECPDWDAAGIGERQRCLCIPVPYECDWRLLEAAAADRIADTELADLYSCLSIADGPTVAKRQRADGADQQATPEQQQQEGVEEEKVVDCLELLGYGDDWQLRVNDVVEVIGVLARPQQQQQQEEEEEAEQSSWQAGAAHPRLHVLRCSRQQQQQPLAELSADQSGFLRDGLLGVLTDLLLGDSLAAEYLLLHLVSSVYLRHSETVPVGKLSLNLACCLPTLRLAERLGSLLSLLLPRLFQLPLSLEFLNGSSLIPAQDCDTCRLRCGRLQLPRHTQLLVDESQLQPGRLDTRGFVNLRALGDLVLYQKVEYDFQLYTKDFEADLRVLVVSEGKSVLPCDLMVPLQPRHFVSEAAAAADFDRLMAKASDDSLFLKEARRYLDQVTGLAASEHSYSVGDDLQLWVEKEFVDARQRARAEERPQLGLSAEELGLRLVMCRLLALALGRRRLDRELWGRVAELEGQRKARLQLAASNN